MSPGAWQGQGAFSLHRKGLLDVESRFLAAALGGMAFGGANYLYFGLPSYLLDGLRLAKSWFLACRAAQELLRGGR